VSDLLSIQVPSVIIQMSNQVIHFLFEASGCGEEHPHYCCYLHLQLLVMGSLITAHTVPLVGRVYY